MKIKMIIAGLAGLSAATLLNAERENRPSREEMRERIQEHVQGVLDDTDVDGDGYYSEDELIDTFATLRADREEMRERMRERAEQSGRDLPVRSNKEGREPPSPDEVATKILEKNCAEGGAIAKVE